mgnify:CR=1 FL=1
MLRLLSRKASNVEIHVKMSMTSVYDLSFKTRVNIVLIICKC